MSKRHSDETPVFFQPRHTDEYNAPAPSGPEREAAARVLDAGPETSARTATSLHTFWQSRRGTAQGLRALNAAWGAEYFVVPPEAELDDDAANAALGGDDVVIDVQTHFVADRTLDRWNDLLMPMYRALMPDWWTGMDNLMDYSMAEYLRCVYLESETALAVLTSAAGTADRRMLRNPELAGARELLDRLGAGGRLLNHSVVEPNHDGQLDAMEHARDTHGPVGWKVYTLGSPGWWLDDDIGLPFLQRARDLGVKLVCAHKGMSALVDTGSPRDVGPAARAFPDLDFVIYHSGYESDGPGEGPYAGATADVGVNRLVTSLRSAGIAAGSNVYAELGTTWFCLLRKPREAAHVLGKLLLAVGEDNVIWGTDGVWYGPAQPTIDAFRAFRIPDELCEQYGYPPLTAARKAKILGGNAARVYGIDTESLRTRVAADDLTWVRAAIAEYKQHGVPIAD
jgi:predicted TIM-barrel fold metal-dependent hydrolase